MAVYGNATVMEIRRLCHRCRCAKGNCRAFADELPGIFCEGIDILCVELGCKAVDCVGGATSVVAILLAYIFIDRRGAVADELADAANRFGGAFFALFSGSLRAVGGFRLEIIHVGFHLCGNILCLALGRCCLGDGLGCCSRLCSGSRLCGGSGLGGGLFRGSFGLRRWLCSSFGFCGFDHF
jgi:hypothetical protein